MAGFTLCNKNGGVTGAAGPPEEEAAAPEEDAASELWAVSYN